MRKETVPMFDWRASQRWRILEDTLPVGSVVRFKPPSLWHEYGGYIAVALATIALQAVTITALMFARRYRRRLDTDRKRAELELQQQRTQLADIGRVALMGEACSIACARALAATHRHLCQRGRSAALVGGTPRRSPRSAGGATRASGSDARRRGRAPHGRFVKNEETTYATLNLNDEIRDVCALVRSDAELQHVKIACEIDESLPFVRGSRAQLQQLLLNLMLNALDAMKEVPGNRSVELRHEQLTRTSGLRRTAGMGFPPRLSIACSNRFTRRRATGSVSALSNCRSILRAHGGELWAENNANGGATFYFVVPTTQD